MTAAPAPADSEISFASMMDLAAHGPDTYVGVGPRYPWGGLYGGQIVAQALRAAALTVEDRFVPHSVHAYFIRRGDQDQPTRFEVDRIRDGRSFCTRRVVARQSVGAIFSCSVSFQADEEAPDVQIASLDEGAGRPEDWEGESWSHLFERRFVEGRWDGAQGRATAWLRITEDLGDDPVVHACALAYLSDDLPTDAVVSLHPDAAEVSDDGGFMSASLDHAIWFHRPIRADQWHVHDLVCHGLLSSRGLAVGHVFSAAGVHLASITQEVLLRVRR